MTFKPDQGAAPPPIYSDLLDEQDRETREMVEAAVTVRSAARGEGGARAHRA